MLESAVNTETGEKNMEKQVCEDVDTDKALEADNGKNQSALFVKAGEKTEKSEVAVESAGLNNPVNFDHIKILIARDVIGKDGQPLAQKTISGDQATNAPEDVGDKTVESPISKVLVPQDDVGKKTPTLLTGDEIMAFQSNLAKMVWTSEVVAKFEELGRQVDELNKTCKQREAVQKEEQTVQKEEQTVQKEEQTVQKEEQTVQKEEQTVQKEEQTVQKEEQKVQKEEKTVQKQEQTVQKEEQTVQKQEQKVQKEAIGGEEDYCEYLYTRPIDKPDTERISILEKQVADLAKSNAEMQYALQVAFYELHQLKSAMGPMGIVNQAQAPTEMVGGEDGKDKKDDHETKKDENEKDQNKGDEEADKEEEDKEDDQEKKEESVENDKEEDQDKEDEKDDEEDREDVTDKDDESDGEGSGEPPKKKSKEM